MDDQDGPPDEPSKTATTLPPQITTLLRRALYTDLQRTSENAPTAGPESYTRAAWIPVLTRMNATARALDAIDWKEPNEQKPVLITLDTTMIGALEAEADHWTWLSEAARTESAEDRARAAQLVSVIEKFLAGLAERPEPVIIPTAAFPVIRECANEALPIVAEDIDRVEVDPWDCARRLIALKDLLDLIGWAEDEGPADDVDATAHARTLTEVAPPLLETMTRHVREYDDDDPDKPKTEKELGFLNEIHTHACELLED
jgi:hypothetical protein